MLRRAAQLVVPAYRRGLHTSAACWEEAQSVEKEEFLEKFQKYVSSTTAPPNFPSDFVEAQPVTEASAAVPDKLTLNFYLPYDQIIKGSKVDLVLIPAVTGDFGVMPGHVATVAQLRPGVVTVHSELDKELEKYFVSSGFAFIHADSSAEICAVEAVKVSDLDPEAVRAGLQEYTAKLAAVAAKGDDYETAAAQVGVEVYSALNAAIS
eukprot:jgi/Botrbrau1/2496/Bobra.0226s0052.1